MTPDRVCSADNRHRSLLTVFDQTPDTAVDAFIAPTAAVVGRVNIQDRSSVGYGCVLRGARAPPAPPIAAQRRRLNAGSAPQATPTTSTLVPTRTSWTGPGPPHPFRARTQRLSRLACVRSIQVKLDKNGAPGGTVIGNYATIGVPRSAAWGARGAFG